jgi:hypothetical protein
VAQVDDAALNSGHGSLDALLWRLTGGFDWREWDGDVVVRVKRSASTLALSPAASAVLMALRQDARSTAELAASLAALEQDDGAGTTASMPEDTIAVQGLIADTLSQLETLDLVERTNAP